MRSGSSSRVLCSVGVLTVWLSAVGLLLSLSIPGQVAFGQEVTGELIRHVRGFITDQVDAGPRAMDAAVAALTELVILEPERIAIENGRLNWTVRRQRKLAPIERRTVLERLDSLLLDVLSHKRLGSNGKPLLPTAAARRLVDQSDIAIATQPALVELTSDQVASALERYVTQHMRKNVHQTQGYRELQRDFAVDAKEIWITGGVIEWSLPMKNPPDLDVRGPIDPLAIQRQLDRIVAPHEPLLRAIVADALGTIPDPILGVPLVDPEDIRNMRFRVTAFGVAFAFAPAGMARVRPTASRGSAERTISRLQLAYPRQEQVPGNAGSTHFLGADSLEPQLVIDTGGFSGAVVNGLAFSPDGRLLAAVGDVVRIWDLASGELLHTLRGQRESGGVGGCTDLAFSPDGHQLLVTASGFDESLRVYNTGDLRQIAEVHNGHDGPMDRVAISTDGNWLVTAGVDNMVNIWDWPKRQIVRSYQFDRPIDHLSFPTADANFLVIDVNGRYDFRSAASGQPADSNRRSVVRQFFTNGRQWPDDGNPHPFALSPISEGEWLAGGIGRRDNDSSYWCAAWFRGERSPRSIFRHKYYVTTCTMSRDGRWAASADALGEIHVWNANDGTEKFVFRSQVKPIYSLDYALASGRLLFGRVPYRVPEWNWNHYGALTHQFDLGSRLITSWRNTSPPSPILRQNGRELLIEPLGDSMHQVVIRSASRRTTVRLPLRGSGKWMPICFSFLRGNAPGFRDGVVLGTEDGGLACIEPDRLMMRRMMMGHTDRVWAVSQSADNRLLASCSGDGTIRVWKLSGFKDWGNLAALTDADGRIYHVFPGSSTAAADVRVGDFVLGLGGQPLSFLAQDMIGGRWPYRSEQTIEVTLQRGQREIRHKVRLSNMGDIGKPLFSIFFSADRRDWVIWTPQGYYDASPDGHRLVGWQVNRGRDRAADFFPLEQFRERLYRPDVIDSLIDVGDLNRALQLAGGDRTTLTDPPNDLAGDDRLRPPRIRILEPALESRTGVARITVRARIVSPKTLPLRNVSVLVNGKPSVTKGIVRERLDGDRNDWRPDHTWSIERSVTLSPGRNEISVVASNRASHSRSNSVWVTYRRTVAPSPQRRLFLVAVGVSEYKDSRFNLKYAHRDAQEFAAAWKTQEDSLYSSVQTRVIVNEDATERAIEEAMDWLVENAASDDVTVLFLSGHGVVDDRQNYYVATYEMNPDRLRSTCLRWSQVQDLAADLSCTLLLFADTCHSGGIAGLRNIVFDPLHELSRDDIGTLVFASCQRRAVSLEDDAWKHGAFTKALLDTFQNPDSDLDKPNDGYLSITELEHNLDRRVRSLTNDRQRPVSQKPQTVKDFNLFQLPTR